MGLTPSTADALLAAGVDVITSGNHIWDKREIYPYLEANDRVLRPLNYGTHDVPGRGWGIYDALDGIAHRRHQPPGPDLVKRTTSPGRGWPLPARSIGTDIAVINLQGRTYMQPIENPFTDADRLLDESSRAAAAGPPRRLPLRADVARRTPSGCTSTGGSASVVGTHTHVVTGDERILPGGTAYQTDLGMTGPSGASSASTRRPSCRASSTRCRRGSRSATARSSSTRSRSTSTRPPAGRSRSSGSSASSRSERCRTPRRRGTTRCRRRPSRRVTAGAVDVDLHTHTTRSDGVLRPRSSSGDALRAGVRILGLTDHDTLAGYRELSSPAGAVPAGLTLIPASRSTRS